MLLIICLLPIWLAAAYLENLPTEVTQPDGSVLSLLASGDEFANRLHDKDGYTIIQSKVDGYFYFAEMINDEPAPSAFRADNTIPQTKNLVPGVNISAARYREKVAFMSQNMNPAIRTPNTGTVNNLCVFIRFSDQTEFPDPRGFYENKFNPTEDDAYSLRNYFHKVSYDQLDFVSYSYPTCATTVNLSYQDSHPRSYYVPYNAVTNPNGYQDSEQRAIREQTMLGEAITALADQIPTDLNIDADNDGYVDNVCFIIRGPHTAWAELLWAHRWGLYYTSAFINGKQVMDYTFQPENHNEVRTLCHEMFHSVGSPDLYHYTYNGMTAVGCWDIMESGLGHMGMYMKRKYGEWIPQLTVISQTGDYTLNPVTSATNNAYRINVAGHPEEFFVLEYRKQDTDIFEQRLPGSGLLIYRINSNYEGNADGPPDEVYIYRPNGTGTANGMIADAAFSAQKYMTEFNDGTNPNCFWTNNTLAHLNISNISAAGETISFHYSSTATSLPPVINITSPADAAVVPIGDVTFTATATVSGSSITALEFRIDGVTVSSQTAAPFTFIWEQANVTTGYHQLVVTATAANGQTSSRQSTFRIVDPQVQTWFSWMTATPVYESYGRGFVPIQAAIDLDLGTQEYLVKRLAFYLSDDPFGDPNVPGLITAKINRFADNAITEQTLLDIGNINCTLGQRFEYVVNSTTPISGKIAVILNLYEYQNMVFDNDGATGHSWITEPNRPWTDALGRGIVGAADIELLLQSPNVADEDNAAVPTRLNLTSYPNPFNPSTTISYQLTKSAEIELTIFNTKGQKVKTLTRTNQPKGTHNIVWNGTNDQGSALSSGVYFMRLSQNGKTTATRRLALLK